MLTVVVARSSSGGVIVRCVLAVLSMSLPCFLHMMVLVARIARIPRRRYRHRHGHPRQDLSRHVRHARFPEVIPMASSTTRRHSRDDPREDVGEEVRVGVGAVECQLMRKLGLCNNRNCCIGFQTNLAQG